MKPHLFFCIITSALLSACAATPHADRVDLARFHAIDLVPVQLAGELAATLSDVERSSLEAELGVALREGVPEAMLADGPGPNVVRVEITVTELNASSPTVNLLTTALLFVPVDKGGIGFEVRLFEGDSREPFDLQTIHYTSSPLKLKGSFSRYGHAKRVLRDWAAGISARLVGAGGQI